MRRIKMNHSAACAETIKSARWSVSVCRRGQAVGGGASSNGGAGAAGGVDCSLRLRRCAESDRAETGMLRCLQVACTMQVARCLVVVRYRVS